MVDLSLMLEIAIGLITVGMTLGMVYNAVHRIEKRILALQFCVVNHSVILAHLGEFLAKTANYQPIESNEFEE